ncbi:VIT1/CCC1 transporter family protein [Candidatus Nitrosocosmicus arcticus]|uniref:VIT1/CCC1 transporter family protein n=1 Tax=Candidatus Nitrosocosmicus arcticus TaxID=2035267 RepID=UPI003CC7F694
MNQATKNGNPMSKAITTFTAFNLVGLIPLIPFILMFILGFSAIYTLENVFLYSIIFTAISFFFNRISKGKSCQQIAYKIWLKYVNDGGNCCSSSFLVGSLLGTYVK